MRKTAAILAVLVSSAVAVVSFLRPGWLARTASFEEHPELPAEVRSSAWFEEIGADGGIEFQHCAGRLTAEYFFPQIMGSGCALFDFDQDGDLDLYLIDGSPGESGGKAQPGACEQPRNRLYRNDGSGAFVDVSAGSGLDFSAVGMGVAVGDVDNDGFPDLYVTNYGPDRLFLNRRDGTFSDITASAGTDNARWGTSCSFVDYDRDGWLDLVVVNYVNYHPSRRCVEPNGRPDYCNPKLLSGTPARLYRNETGLLPNAGNGARAENVPPAVRFRDVSLESQLALKSGPGLGVVCADFDGDRWPDILVANDGAPNFLWGNGRDGTFHEAAVACGVAYDRLGHPQANMGVALGDVDGDGGIDLLITHLGGEGSALFLSRGAGVFEESAGTARLAAPTFPWTGFGAAFGDFDHDGALDLAVVNGRVKRRDGAPFPPFLPGGSAVSPAHYWDAYAERNQLYVNDGAGRFHLAQSGAEPFMGDAGVYRGLAVGDVDNDGDLDLVVTNTAGAARVFRNVAPRKGHWLVVRAVEPALGGRDALGATVTVTAGGRQWVRLVNAGGSYLSASDPRVHFGLGNVETIDRVEMLWPDGSDEVFDGGAVDRFLTLEHGRGRAP
ncbi:MAG: CRTAC1 family protein [Deltaproteobacteria bacterium]